MVLSDEQVAVVESRGSVVVNAGAGCAKTSTMIEYARRRPGQRILYIVYNKSARTEAEKRFLKAGVTNVTIVTAHSLAYGGLNVSRRFTLCQGGNFRANDVAELCSIKPSKAGSVAHLVLARHILNYLNFYLNSDARRLADADYLSICTDGPGKQFAAEHCETIYNATKSLLLRMYRSEIPVTHDGYLKFFGLTDPMLDYSHVLLDEAQDASAVMLDIFRKQPGIKVAVGDSNQSIYAFRHAVDSLSTFDDNFEPLTLSRSFRFPQSVADLAMRVLRLKKWIGKYDEKVNLIGAGTTANRKTSAILARGNIALLDRAIGLMLEDRKVRMHFEGDFSSYVYGGDGNLYDVLYLYLNRPEKISNPFIRGFKQFPALEEYVTQTGDNEIGMMAECVKKYGSDLFTLIRDLKEVQTAKTTADIVLSTCHKAKGAEWDSCEILPGYINLERIKKLLAADAQPAQKGKTKTPLDLEALNQEINILYVAVTRTRCHHLIQFDIDDGPQLYRQPIDPHGFHFRKEEKPLSVAGGLKPRRERSTPREEYDLFAPLGQVGTR